MKFDSYSKIVLGLVHPRRFGTVMSLSAESHLVINTMMNTIVRKAISGAKKIARFKNNKAKEIKQKQKELLKLEQKELSIRLKNIKKGRPELMNIDTELKQQMKMELQKLSNEYAMSDNNPNIF